MDARKLIGFGVMVVVVLAAVGWVISSPDPQGALDMLGPVAVGVMVVVLAAALFADRRYFDAPRRPAREFLVWAVFAALALKLAVDGYVLLAVATAIGIVVLIVMAIRQHPRAEQPTNES
jgi:hypothetical protein